MIRTGAVPHGRVPASVPTIATPAATASARRRRRRRQQRAAPRIPRGQRRARQRGAAARLPAMTVDPCTVKYARAIVDPWDCDPGACLPSGFPLPSGRRKLFSRFTMDTSDAGMGFVLVSPGRFASSNGNGTAATGSGVYYSANNYAGSTFAANTATTGCFAAQSNSDYDTSSGVRYRTVSLGIRLTNTTAVLDSGGVAYCLTEPDHKNMTSFGASDMAAYDQCRVEPITLDGRKVSVLLGSPTDPLETEFTALPTGAPTIPLENYVIGIITRCPGHCSFFVEVTAHYEFIGTSVRSKEVDNASPAGMSAVASAFQTLTAKLINPAADKTLFYQTVLKYATLAGAAVPTAIALATGASQGLVAGASRAGLSALNRAAIF